MRVISRKALREFWKVHPAAQRPLQTWYTIASSAHWQSFTDLRRDVPSADLVERLTVFNIAGNKFRLVVRIEFEAQKIYVRHVLTHAEYSKENWKDDSWYSRAVN